MKTGFIGAGKVGCSLGKYLNSHGVEVTGYYDRDTRAAEEAARFTGTLAFAVQDSLVEASEVVFVTVPDAYISSAFEEIKSCDISGKYVCHCSGSISAKEAFPGVHEAGAYEYSVHPLFAVSDRFDTYRELADAFFTLEGNEEHIEPIRQMLEEAGLRVRVIDSADKPKYHLAAVMVSNLVLALVGEGTRLLEECGFEDEDALEALGPLARGNMEHSFMVGPAKALTGPVERGDVQTLKKHLDVLEEGEDRQMYILLSRKLLELARRKHPDRDYTELTEFLS